MIDRYGNLERFPKNPEEHRYCRERYAPEWAEREAKRRKREAKRAFCEIVVIMATLAAVFWWLVR
jgi:hypothetical protein